MYAIKIGADFLDIDPSTSITLETTVPFFVSNGIPGTISYPTSARLTKNNRRLLGFTDIISNQEYTSGRIENAQLYLGKNLYKTGVLRNIKPSKDQYSFNFSSDAGDFQSLITGVSLQSLDLGNDVLSFANTSPKYALFPVYNPGFFGDKNGGYKGYINYYFNNNFSSNSNGNYVISPFPYLVYIIRRIFSAFGYFVTGSWLDNNAVNRIVIYNNYALAANQTSIVLRNHVPDITVGEFLVAIKGLFGIDYIFYPSTKAVSIVMLNEIIDNQDYADYTKKSEPDYEIELNDSNGFKLKQEIDSSDEAFKNESDSWASLKVDNGGEELSTKASTTLVNLIQDSNNPRSWTVPITDQKGTSVEYGLGVNKFSLRLLMYNGMKPDSTGNFYPHGSYQSDSLSLRWEGQNGLYQKYWARWLQLKSETKLIKRNIRFNSSDIRSLQINKKVMINYNKFLFSKITTQVSQKETNKNQGIKPSKVELYKVNL